MTEKDKELQTLHADLQWLLQSEAVREVFKKDSRGRHICDIAMLDRTIRNLHAAVKDAEKKRMAAEAECVNLRRKIEAILLKLEEENHAYTEKPDRKA